MVVKKLKGVVIDALEELKCRDLTCLDVRELTGLFDYMIIVSGNSTRHVKSLADNVVTRCREEGVRPLGVEGETPGDWVLIDMNDIVVHVMLPATREFYDLERLWGKLDGEDKSSGKE